MFDERYEILPLRDEIYGLAYMLAFLGLVPLAMGVNWFAIVVSIGAAVAVGAKVVR